MPKKYISSPPIPSFAFHASVRRAFQSKLKGLWWHESIMLRVRRSSNPIIHWTIVSCIFWFLVQISLHIDRGSQLTVNDHMFIRSAFHFPKNVCHYTSSDLSKFWYTYFEYCCCEAHNCRVARLCGWPSYQTNKQFCSRFVCRDKVQYSS